ARRVNPFVQRHAADTERILQILIRTRAEAVEGNAEAVDAKFRRFGRRSHVVETGRRDAAPDNTEPAIDGRGYFASGGSQPLKRIHSAQRRGQAEVGPRSLLNPKPCAPVA